ncbi:hypothetical protein VP01_1664g2 [Puccinia sorghi]|uniref:Uncharacterized protein n=1 Tax=Puccinia sorghi TaxID=27349 RepID=A0A0L6VG90_9BASI|nr:hypothetical protein VP01_1664g2 [Puccinia sorghi]
MPFRSLFLHFRSLIPYLSFSVVAHCFIPPFLFQVSASLIFSLFYVFFFLLILLLPLRMSDCSNCDINFVISLRYLLVFRPKNSSFLGPAIVLASPLVCPHSVIFDPFQNQATIINGLCDFYFLKIFWISFQIFFFIYFLSPQQFFEKIYDLSPCFKVYDNVPSLFLCRKTTRYGMVESSTTLTYNDSRIYLLVKGTLTAVNKQKGPIITSCLDAMVHTNVITNKNKEDVLLMWKAINNSFASNHFANCSRFIKKGLFILKKHYTYLSWMSICSQFAVYVKENHQESELQNFEMMNETKLIILNFQQKKVAIQIFCALIENSFLVCNKAVSMALACNMLSKLDLFLFYFSICDSPVFLCLSHVLFSFFLLCPLFHYLPQSSIPINLNLNTKHPITTLSLNSLPQILNLLSHHYLLLLFLSGVSQLGDYLQPPHLSDRLGNGKHRDHNLELRSRQRAHCQIEILTPVGRAYRIGFRGVCCGKSRSDGCHKMGRVGRRGFGKRTFNECRNTRCKQLRGWEGGVFIVKVLFIRVGSCIGIAEGE